MSLLQPYQVSIVHADLNSPEVLKDLFYALNHLSTTIDDVFTRIEKRIGEERKRVDQIKSRISSCKVAVDKVSGSARATTVFSTAKFPAPKMLPSYPTLFSQINAMPSCYRDVEDEDLYTLPMTKDSLLVNRDLEVEVTGILYRLNTNNTDLERVEFTMEEDGLGSLPPTIASVGSLLLFNSNINPYKDYQTLDNLISSGKEKAAAVDELKTLAHAPISLVDGDSLPDIQALDLLFKPQMGEMTTLALPENLPIDFIATGITFNAGDLPSIAPSAAFGNKPNYALPQLGYDPYPSAKQSSAVASPAASLPSSNLSPPPPPQMASSPPPPPPPPPALHMAQAPPTQQPPPPQMQSSPPPPPPPSAYAPPPPPQPPVYTEAEAEIETEPEAASMPPGNPLLDAISGFSLNKLRGKEESAFQASKLQKKNKVETTTDTFADLKERLARRNNAISGKDDKEQKRRDSLIVQDARLRQAAVAALSAASLSPPSTKPQPPKPAPPTASRPPPPSKPSALVSLGFAAVDDANDNNSDGDSFGGFQSRRVPLSSHTDEDSDSIVSDFSDESRFTVTVKPPPVPPQRSLAFMIPPPVVKPVEEVKSPPPLAVPGGSGGGLLDTSNEQVSQMLHKASIKAEVEANSDEDDDWD